LKISIITISYNRAATIARAIESVLSQDYADVEYIVVDGASTDGTQQVIEQYKEKISRYISEPDGGMYEALNKAIGMATGDVVGILHSDDVFYATDILSQYAATFKQTDADVVYANGLYITDNGQQTTDNGSLMPELETRNSKLETYKVKRIYRSSPFKPWYLYFGWIPLHTTIFVRREVFESFGLYDESYSIASDYEISLRWFTRPELKKVYMNRMVVKMGMGGKSTSMALQKKKSTEDARVLKQYKLWGKLTLAFKILRKIPQYLMW